MEKEKSIGGVIAEPSIDFVITDHLLPGPTGAVIFDVRRQQCDGLPQSKLLFNLEVIAYDGNNCPTGDMIGTYTAYYETGA